MAILLKSFKLKLTFTNNTVDDGSVEVEIIQK